MSMTRKKNDGTRRRIPRWTLSREAVMDLLSQTSRHMSAKEIHQSLLKNISGIGLCTVYRTLSLLTREGLINKLDTGTGGSRYEYREGPDKEHHHHIICVRCGKIIDFDDLRDDSEKMFRQAEWNIKKKYKFAIQDYHVEFYGICENCR